MRDPQGDPDDPRNQRWGVVWGARRGADPARPDAVDYVIRYDPDDPHNPPDPNHVDLVDHFVSDPNPPTIPPGFNVRPNSVPRPPSVNPPGGPPGSPPPGGPGGSRRPGNPPPGGPPGGPGGPPNPPNANRPSWLRRGVGRLQTAAWKTVVPGFWFELGMENRGWLENHPKARRAIATVGGLAVATALTKGVAVAAGEMDLPELNLDSPVSFQSPRSESGGWQSPIEFDNPFSPDAHDGTDRGGGGGESTGPADETTGEGGEGTGGAEANTPSGEGSGADQQPPPEGTTPEGEVALPEYAEDWNLPDDEGWTPEKRDALLELDGHIEDRDRLRDIFEHPDGEEARNLRNFFDWVRDSEKEIKDNYAQEHDGGTISGDDLTAAMDEKMDRFERYVTGSEAAEGVEPQEIPETENIVLEVPEGEGFENTLQQQFGWSDEVSARAFQAMEPALLEDFHTRGADSGMYMGPDGLRISDPGNFHLSPRASEALRQFMDTLNKNPLDEDLPQAA